MSETLHPVREDEYQWELSSASHSPALITTLGLIEGDVLARLEREGRCTLRELTRGLPWSSRLMAMAVGGLIREHAIRARQTDMEIVLERLPEPAGTYATHEAVPEVWGG